MKRAISAQNQILRTFHKTKNLEKKSIMSFTDITEVFQSIQETAIAMKRMKQSIGLSKEIDFKDRLLIDSFYLNSYLFKCDQIM